MPFSRAQQPELRSLLALAWKGHCEEEGISPVDRCKGNRCGDCAYCSWYEQTLFQETGHTSTTECNAGRDYDLFMAELERIGRAGIKWQMKVHRGDAVRIMHELREAVGQYADEMVDEDYLRSVAQQALQLSYLPELKDLNREQLIFLLGEVKRWLRRKAKKERFTAPPAQPPSARVGTKEEVAAGLVIAPF